MRMWTAQDRGVTNSCYGFEIVDEPGIPGQKRSVLAPLGGLSNPAIFL